MKPPPDPMDSGNHLSPTAPVTWRKFANPAVAVTFVKLICISLVDAGCLLSQVMKSITTKKTVNFPAGKRLIVINSMFLNSLLG
jgi:hypothetical protein